MSVSSFISFISVLQFSMYRSFVSLSRYTPRYFILFVAMVNGIFPLISLSVFSLLVYRNARDFFWINFKMFVILAVRKWQRDPPWYGCQWRQWRGRRTASASSGQWARGAAEQLLCPPPHPLLGFPVHHGGLDQLAQPWCSCGSRSAPAGSAPSSTSGPLWLCSSSPIETSAEVLCAKDTTEIHKGLLCWKLIYCLLLLQLIY